MPVSLALAARLLTRLKHALPEGRDLPDRAWHHRHQVILILLWLHVISLSLWGLIAGLGPVHSLGEVSVVAALTLLGSPRTFSRRVRSGMATLGLLTSSALVVHLSGGYIEMHFHFFVMIIIIALYQNWFPFLLAIGYVVVHHGLVGVLAPASVYNHPAAWAHPWRWAAIHAAFVMGASIASLVTWRLSESAYARAELILGSAGEGIVGLDSVGRITFANTAAVRTLGWENEDLRGRLMAEIVPFWEPNATSFLGEDRASSFGRDGAHRLSEGVFQRKDGSSVPVEYVGTPIREQGDLVGAVVVFKDITERKRAEETATALAHISRALSQSLDAGVIGHRIADSMRELLGALVASLLWVDPRSGGWTVVAVSGEGGAGFSEEVVYPGEASATGLALRERRPVVTPDVLTDPRITVTPEARSRVEQAGYRAVLALPLVIHERPIGVLAVGAEVGRLFTGEEIGLAQAFADQAATALENARLYHEAQQAYEELARTQDRLVQSQKMEAVGQLAGGIAHDFNNLLTVITGRARLVADRLPSDDPLQRDIGLVDKTAQRAAALTQQLLAFSRKQVLQPKVLDLNAIVNQDMMLQRLIGEDIDLITVLDPEVGRIQADPGQLQQVILNLSINARDAMPRGGTLTIRTANAELDPARAARYEVEPGPYVVLSVSDTGSGMDTATQARIFEPFFTTKEQGRGTGLGLSTVYGIVKQSGGHILVDSAPGRGSTFTVYLPRVPAVGGPDGQTAMTRPRQGSETIMLVEDEEGVRQLACEVLQREGYAVLQAADGVDALRKSERFRGPIHLLVTDVVMPRMSGRELSERLAPGRPAMKVLYMSGYTDDAIVHHGVLDAGVCLLEKPFTPDGLARKIREVLDAPPDGPSLLREGAGASSAALSFAPQN